jgi:hypothetical protein
VYLVELSSVFFLDKMERDLRIIISSKNGEGVHAVNLLVSWKNLIEDFSQFIAFLDSMDHHKERKDHLIN